VARTLARPGAGRCARTQAAVACAIAGVLGAAIDCSDSSNNPVCVDAGDAGNDALSQDGGVVVIRVTAAPADCPKIAKIVAIPYIIDVGSSAMVKADVSSSDAGPPTLNWSAPSGTFAEPAASETAFVCGVAGPVQLTFTVTFGDCRVTASVPIECR
jgi:hypothetical protein